MIDVSDGLLADLGHVAAASGVVVDLDTARLAVGAPLAEAAGALNLDPLSWVLTGGDDNALVATFPPDFWRPEGFVVVGEVVAAGDGAATRRRGCWWTADRTRARPATTTSPDPRPSPASARCRRAAPANARRHADGAAADTCERR